MKLYKTFDMKRRKNLRSLMVQALLLSLVIGMFQIPASAAGNACHTSSPPSSAYTVNVCITSPSDGATINGLRNVTATADVTGTNPGVAKLIFYLGGEYLITDFQTPFSFDLPTTKWVDGSRLLEVEALMKDNFTSERASISLTFNNGIVQPPVNNNAFTPKSGTTPPAGQSFTLAAAGDGAGGLLNAADVSDLIASWNPNLFLYLGDVYEKGSKSEFYNWYGTSSTFFGRFRSITDPIVGNHEYTADITAPGYFDYWDNVPNYYSFDAAGWHIIALNSNCGKVGGCQVNSPQYQWLAADLAAHPNICTIAFYHHPVYFVGPSDDPQNMGAVWSLLAQYGVDLILNGHDHNYQRWKPLDGTGALSSNGVTEFVVGGGGHGMQEFVTTDHRLAVGFDTPDAFGALRLQLNQDGAGFQYINTADTVLDFGSVVCSGAPADITSPSKPTNLTATSSDSNLVHLTWKASTDNVGVTGYDIYRDGAHLATIPPVTSYDDLTVLPDTTYSYKIRAHDAAGNVSSQTSAVTVTTPGLLFSDGFESGDFTQWTSAHGLTIQQQQVYAGVYAARGTSNGTATYANKQLSQTQNELYYRLWFKILSQNATSQVYLQRFRTITNGAIMGVFVNSNNKLSFRNDVSGVSTTSSITVTQGTWHELQTRILINGNAGEAEIWLDGTRIADLSKTENFGNTKIGLIQLGENSTGRTYDIVLDRVALSTNFINSSDPPEVLPPTLTPTATPTRTPTPTKTSTPTSTATATATPMGDHDLDTTGVFRPSNGALYLKNSNTTGFADVAINYGMAGDYPVVGDWDGNGTATIGIYRNGVFYLRNSNTIGVADWVFAFGAPGDQPIAGDWDGDGVDTIGVYQNGTFLLRNSNSAGAASASFVLGNVGDVGIAGDWNGDGMDTTGVFRPSNGALYLKNANTTGFADIVIHYGIAGDQPVTGDWNNDGLDTIGVYRNGTFYLRNSNTIGVADLVFSLGINGDIPIAGNWDGLP